MTRRPNKSDRPSRLDKPKAKPAAPDDLPTLPPMEGEDDLPVLEPVDEPAVEPQFAVNLTCGASEEAGFDTAIAIEVPELDKKAMADAVAEPLQHALDSGKVRLRHHRVLVRFSGDAIIGSAVKERCGQILQAAKARKVVVRRGYGDEVLFEHEAPRAEVTHRVEGTSLLVEVDTGELEPVDLSMALQGPLLQVARDGRGLKVQIGFRGKHKPDAQLRDLIQQMLRDGGVLRAAIGQRVLFDRELEDRVRFESKGEVATVRVEPAADEADTEEALAMQLGSLGDRVRGKVVRVTFVGDESESVRSSLLRYCTAGAPQRIEIVRDEGVEVAWPPVLTVDGGNTETVLRIVPNGRDHRATVVSFSQEVRDYRPVVAQKQVLVVWPQGTVVDSELAARCLSLLVDLGATAVAWTAGADRERFHPPVVAGSHDGGKHVVSVDTEAGKPAEVQRAFQRWITAHGDGLQKADVVLAFRGQAAVSRTLLRGLTDSLVALAPSTLEVECNGRSDLVVPPMLRIRDAAADVVSIDVADGSRSAEQIDAALARELDAVPTLAGKRIRIESGGHAEAVTGALVARGVAVVELGGTEPVQVHPRLFGFERGKRSSKLALANGADPAMAVRAAARELPALAAELAASEVVLVGAGGDVAREPAASIVARLVDLGVAKVRLDDGSGAVQQVHPVVPREFVTVLGKKDDAVPPLVMFGIGLGGGDQQERVLSALAERADLLVGRRVLLVGRRDGCDVPFPTDDALADAVRAFVDGAAAATLLFAGSDPRGRNYFAVAHSSVEGLAKGATFADPRPRS